MQSVRVSPHFYNDEEEIGRALQAVCEILGSA
jgi:selenocysteine lyase/cysteine desulfurase